MPHLVQGRPGATMVLKTKIPLNFRAVGNKTIAFSHNMVYRSGDLNPQAQTCDDETSAPPCAQVGAETWKTWQ